MVIANDRVLNLKRKPMRMYKPNYLCANNAPYSSSGNPQHYCVSVVGLGGRVVVGRIPSAIARYWNGIDHDTLARHHVVNDGRLDLDLNDNQIDPGFSLTHWSECHDVMQETGPVVEGEPDVIIHQGNAVLLKGRVGRKFFKNCVLEPEYTEIDESSSVLMAHTAEVVQQTYCIDVIGRFNPRKLRVRSRIWGGVSVICGLEYDGVPASLSTVETLPFDDDQAVMGIVLNDNDSKDHGSATQG